MKKYLEPLAKRLKFVQDYNSDHQADRLTKQITIIRQELKNSSNQERALGMKNYMKGVDYQFYGVSSPVLKDTVFRNTYEKSAPFPDKFFLAYELLQSKMFQEKLYALQVLEKNHRQIDLAIIGQIKQLIYQGHFDGWALTDSLSKVIRLTCLDQGPSLDDYIAEWSQDNKNIWVRRASCVSFVVRAKHGDNPRHNYPDFMNKMFQICKNCLKFDDRFTQLGVGWLLREMTVADKAKTVAFIKQHHHRFIRQGLRYAIEKLEPEMKQQLLNYKSGNTNTKQPTKARKANKQKEVKK